MSSEMFKLFIQMLGGATILIAMVIGYAWIYSESAGKLAERYPKLGYLIIGCICLDVIGFVVLCFNLLRLSLA